MWHGDGYNTVDYCGCDYRAAQYCCDALALDIGQDILHSHTITAGLQGSYGLGASVSAALWRRGGCCN